MENVIEKRPEMEGAGTVTGVSDNVNGGIMGSGSMVPAETEVTWRHGKRKKYTENYKRQVVDHVAELRRTGQGDIGGYLRREGLYYTMVNKWEKKLMSKGNQQQQETGKSAREKELEERARLLEKELEEARKELTRTKKKLEKSEMIIDFQKKISILLNPDQEEKKD